MGRTNTDSGETAILPALRRVRVEARARTVHESRTALPRAERRPGTLGGMELAELLLAGDVRALARAIRMAEDGHAAVADLLAELRAHMGGAHVFGVTGPPGSGKSTVCDQVIAAWRAQGWSVGVLAVDPSSPFSGGAILGDRVRMQRHAGDREVFIRSMAARGHLGGLARSARDVIRLMDAAGRQRCLVETVGVGQSELDVMRTVDTTAVVLTPAAGDSVQIIKAGILEIADIFVVNKADVPGAPRLARELRELVHQTRVGRDWEPPVIQTTATAGEGIAALVTAVDAHRDHLVRTGDLAHRRADRVRAEIEAIVAEHAVHRARRILGNGALAQLADSDMAAADPHAIADQILNAHEVTSR